MPDRLTNGNNLGVLRAVQPGDLLFNRHDGLIEGSAPLSPIVNASFSPRQIMLIPVGSHFPAASSTTARIGEVMFWSNGRFGCVFVSIVLFTTFTIVGADIIWRTVRTSAFTLGSLTGVFWLVGIAIIVFVARKLNGANRIKI